MKNGGLRTKGINKITTPEKTLITVITVVFNGGTTLEQTIQSVINQTYDNIEYIIIDGGSSDNTLEIIKKYEDKIDYWQSESDSGIYDAMNKGIALATGDFIVLLNADDWFEKETCKIVSEEIKKQRNDVYYGIARVLNKEMQTVDIHGSTIFRINIRSIAHQTCFISSKVYEKFKYDTNYKSAADYDFIATLVENNISFKFIEKFLVNYRLNGMSDSIVGWIETYEVMYKHHFISFAKYFLCKVNLLLKLKKR